MAMNGRKPSPAARRGRGRSPRNNRTGRWWGVVGLMGLAVAVCVAARRDAPSGPGRKAVDSASDREGGLAAVAEFLAGYNEHGEDRARELLSGLTLPPDVWERMGADNPVNQSVAALRAYGRPLALADPAVEWAGSERGRIFMVRGKVGASARDRLAFMVSAGNGPYAVVQVGAE